MSWQDFLSSFNSPSGATASNPNVPSFVTDLVNSVAQGAEFGGAVGAAAAGVKQAIQSAVGLIGRGRREADIIVPLQNQVGGVLANVNTLMNTSGATVQQLGEAYALTVNTYRNFEQFTRDARFTDGRASVQARETIRPLVDGKNDAGQVVRSDGGTLGNLERKIVALGGVAPGTVSSGGSPGAVAPPGVTPNNNALLVGGAVIGAKLLGFF